MNKYRLYFLNHQDTYIFSSYHSLSLSFFLYCSLFFSFFSVFPFVFFLFSQSQLVIHITFIKTYWETEQNIVDLLHLALPLSLPHRVTSFLKESILVHSIMFLNGRDVINFIKAVNDREQFHSIEKALDYHCIRLISEAFFINLICIQNQLQAMVNF